MNRNMDPNASRKFALLHSRHAADLWCLITLWFRSNFRSQAHSFYVTCPYLANPSPMRV